MVEQTHVKAFNRAKLFNVGFLESKVRIVFVNRQKVLRILSIRMAYFVQGIQGTYLYFDFLRLSMDTPTALCFTMWTWSPWTVGICTRAPLSPDTSPQTWMSSGLVTSSGFLLAIYRHLAIIRFWILEFSPLNLSIECWRVYFYTLEHEGFVWTYNTNGQFRLSAVLSCSFSCIFGYEHFFEQTLAL